MILLDAAGNLVARGSNPAVEASGVVQVDRGVEIADGHPEGNGDESKNADETLDEGHLEVTERQSQWVLLSSMPLI